MRDIKVIKMPKVDYPTHVVNIISYKNDGHKWLDDPKFNFNNQTFGLSESRDRIYIQIR